MPDPRLQHLLDVQCGVVGRAQALEVGLTDNDIRRLIRGLRLTQVHAGVYVDHTGPLTWLQRAWSAVLFCRPAALCDESARRIAGGPGGAMHDDGRPIHVGIDHSRRVRAPAGIEVHRIVGLDDQVLWNASPPRQRLEHTTVRLAARAPREIDAIACIADAVGARLTTATRLGSALATMNRSARRQFLSNVIADVAGGTCSSLEHGFLVNVERPHGLPTPSRQFRESLKGPVYRDALYEEFGLIVELDGRIHHTKARQHDSDLERDLDAVVTRRETIRLGWGQAYDRACSTAFKLGAVFIDRGWTDRPRRCPACPADLPFAA